MNSTIAEAGRARMLRALKNKLKSRAASTETLQASDFGIFRPGYAAQVERGFGPRNGGRAIKLAVPLDWDMDPFNDRNWRFHLHAWRMLDPIWQELHGKDWARLRSEVLPWVRDWYDFHVIGGKESAFSWYDMAAGFRAQHLALLVHLHDSGDMPLSSRDLAMVEALCRMHHDRLRNRHFIAMNNHGVFQLQGLRLLGAACSGREGYEGEPRYSSRMMLKLLETQFDEFGVHVENSPEYHGLILKQIARIRPELFPDISDRIRTIVSKAREVLPWFTFPDGRIAPLGDSEGLSTMLGTGARADAALSDARGNKVLLRDMSASGYVVVRTSPEVDPAQASMMIVKGHSTSTTHAHADNLSFVLYEGGRPLLIDSGKYTYVRDRWRDYFAGDKAHNVVGLKGVKMGPQHLDSDTAGLSRVEIDADAGRVLVSGEVSKRGYFHHRRVIDYQPSRQVEITDMISAREDDAAVVYWHLAPNLDAERSHGGVNIYDNGRHLARITVDDPAIKARLASGQEKPYIQGWVSPSYGVRKAATVIEFHSPKATQRIRSLIELVEREKRYPAILPRRLTHGVRFRFPYRFRRDRVFLLPTGHTQRRVIVELPDGDLVLVARRLRAALTEKGFTGGRAREEEGGTRANYVHEDGTKIITKLKYPIGATEERSATQASLYFAWSRVAQTQVEGEEPLVEE